MKAFVSIDIEGMPHIVSVGHLNLKGTLYAEARKIATKVTLAAAEELSKNGFSEVVVADSHGPMVNLLVEDLPEYIEVVRGYPRPLSMIAGVDGCDAALFLGYHAKFGTAKSTFDHTYSGRSITRVKVNGIESSEFLLNAYAAGEFNIPVILVAGERQLLEDDVKRHAPWVETVALKHSFSRVSAKSASLVKIEKELRGAVKTAIAKFNRKEAKPLIAEKPVNVGITFSSSQFADAAELLPFIRRNDGLNIEYKAGSILEAYRIFEFLALAATGVTAIIESSQ